MCDKEGLSYGIEEMIRYASVTLSKVVILVPSLIMYTIIVFWLVRHSSVCYG